MFALSHAPIRYVPRTPTPAPAVTLGRAFERLWHSRSEMSRGKLEHAIHEFVECLRRDELTPEAAVIAFKGAIRHFGGIHEVPSLALVHHEDGDESAAVYAEAFSLFVESYFAPSRG